MTAKSLGIVELPADGSPEAALTSLASIYRQHHGFVWRNARRLGCDSSNVDDIVHEVFLVVARRLHEFRGEAQLRSWLFAITYHVVQRLRRDRARYAKRLDAYEDCRDTEAACGGSAQEEAAHQLRQILRRLSEPKRLVFIMAELEGMTSVEIGHCLGMKTGTVDSRLRAARSDLRDIIEREQAKVRRLLP